MLGWALPKGAGGEKGDGGGGMGWRGDRGAGPPLEDPYNCRE